MVTVRTSPRRVAVELLRLVVVLTFLAAGLFAAGSASDLVPEWPIELTQLFLASLGAAVGYVAGGLFGRGLIGGVERATSRVEQVSAAQLVAGSMGAALFAVSAGFILLPFLLLPFRQVTYPIATVVMVVALYAGATIGMSRSGDLARFIGVKGRVEVSSPSRGGGTKTVDSSALLDSRLSEVARAGFLEGSLVVPMFVLEEVQGIADSSDPQRRQLGRDGLDQVKVLQEESLVTVEVTDERPGNDEVDAQLVTLSKSRSAMLLTGDSNLARVAEIAGVRVLNLHVLADVMRPRVLPGETVQLRLVKPGRDQGQAVGYLPDGTMVVVEDAASRVGEDIDVDVTSIVQGKQGRMLFATLST